MQQAKRKSSQHGNSARRAALTAAAILALALCGCILAAQPAQRADTALDGGAALGDDEKVTAPAAPETSEAPAPIAGTWAVTVDGLSLRLELRTDGRFSAVSTETAGTVKTFTTEGSYTQDCDGALTLTGAGGAYRCIAQWTEATLTIVQEGFEPLVLERVEEQP